MSLKVLTFASERWLTSPSEAFENMTTEELRRNVGVRSKGSGTYLVNIIYRGRVYYCYSHNSLAYDRLSVFDITTERYNAYGYTYKQALQAFYNECKRKNYLG